MDETIGAKGGANDRRRRLKITTKQLQSLIEQRDREELKKEEERIKKKKELERIIRRNDIITFIKIAPLILIGNFYDVLKKETPEQKILKEYERLKKEEYLSNYSKNKENIFDGVVIIIKEKDTYKIIDTKYNFDKNQFLNIEQRLNERLEYKVKIENFKETKLLSDEDKKVIENLSPNEIVSLNENKISKIKEELDRVAAEYIKITGEVEDLANAEDIDSMIEKIEEITTKLENLKKENENIDTNIETFEEEHIDGIDDSIHLSGNTKYTYKIDTDIYLEIEEEIDDLNNLKQKLENEKEQEKEEEKEDIDLRDYENKKYEMDRINNEVKDILEIQAEAIKKMNEKIANSTSYRDRVHVRFETVNEITQRTRQQARNRLNGGGPFALRALSALSALTLGMARNIMIPNTVTEITTESIVKDYANEIASNLDDIEDALKSVNTNIEDIDNMILELQQLYPDYSEVDDLIVSLNELKEDLEDKQKELEYQEQEEQKLYKENNEKVLKKV